MNKILDAQVAKETSDDQSSYRRAWTRSRASC